MGIRKQKQTLSKHEIVDALVRSIRDERSTLRYKELTDRVDILETKYRNKKIVIAKRCPRYKSMVTILGKPNDIQLNEYRDGDVTVTWANLCKLQIDFDDEQRDELSSLRKKLKCAKQAANIACPNNIWNRKDVVWRALERSEEAKSAVREAIDKALVEWAESEGMKCA